MVSRGRTRLHGGAAVEGRREQGTGGLRGTAVQGGEGAERQGRGVMEVREAGGVEAAGCCCGSSL